MPPPRRRCKLAQAEVIERALRLGLQDLDMLLQEEEVRCNAQTYRNHAKARYGRQLPLFSEDNGMAGGEGEA